MENSKMEFVICEGKRVRGRKGGEGRGRALGHTLTFQKSSTILSSNFLLSSSSSSSSSPSPSSSSSSFHNSFLHFRPQSPSLPSLPHFLSFPSSLLTFFPSLPLYQLFFPHLSPRHIFSPLSPSVSPPPLSDSLPQLKDNSSSSSSRISSSSSSSSRISISISSSSSNTNNNNNNNN